MPLHTPCSRWRVSRSALAGAVVVALGWGSIPPLSRSVGVLPGCSSRGTVIWLPGRDGCRVGLLVIVSTLSLGGDVRGTVLLLGSAIGGLLGCGVRRLLGLVPYVTYTDVRPFLGPSTLT